MYTVPIGKRLIAAVNRRDQTQHTACSFFDDMYYPLFFGSERFLQVVNNSPVDQAFKNKKKNALTPERLRACRDEIHRKAREAIPDASFFVGGAAAGTDATTSGQVTAMRLSVSEEDVYASWIGAALGVGVAGGLSLLLDDDDVLLAVYDGWRGYRALLDQTDNLKAQQINTWNGQWLAYRFGRDFQAGVPLPPSARRQAAGDQNELTTQTWVQLLFALAYHFRDMPEKRLTAYVYALGQMNTTLGFVRLNLPQVRRPADLYETLFGALSGMPPKQFETLYETEFGFRRACEAGEIGLRALQPKGLLPYLADRGARSPAVPKRPRDDQERVTFQIYQTWIIAMLNNKELLDQAERAARALHDFTKQATRGKKTHQSSVDDVLAAKSRKQFIDALTQMVQEEARETKLLNELVTHVLTMPLSSVPLFLTLLRFKYAYVSANGGSAQ